MNAVEIPFSINGIDSKKEVDIETFYQLTNAQQILPALCRNSLESFYTKTNSSEDTFIKNIIKTMAFILKSFNLAVRAIEFRASREPHEVAKLH